MCTFLCAIVTESPSTERTLYSGTRRRDAHCLQAEVALSDEVAVQGRRRDEQVRYGRLAAQGRSGAADPQGYAEVPVQG